jgi:hypothetical protein
MGFCVTMSSAWDPAAHQACVKIALDHVPNRVLRRIKLILGNQDKVPVDPIAACLWPSDSNQGGNASWKFADRSFVINDGSTRKTAGTMEITLLRALDRASAKPSDALSSAEALAVLLFLVPEAHEPAHCATQFGQDKDGDNFGHRLTVNAPRLEHGLYSIPKKTSLHDLWDGILDKRMGNDLNALIKEIRQSPRKDLTVPTFRLSDAKATIATWIDESFEIAKTEMYKDPAKSGSDPASPNSWIKKGDTISGDYLSNALVISEDRILIAAYRLAGVLIALYDF